MERRNKINQILASLGLMTMGAWVGLLAAGILHNIPDLAADSLYALFVAAILLTTLLLYNRKHLKEIFTDSTKQ